MSVPLQKNWFIGLVQKFVIGLFLVSCLLLVLRFRALPPLVPLWFSRPWGNDQLAHPFWLFILPVSSLGWYGINYYISTKKLEEYLLFAQMLYLSSLIVSLMSFFILVKILFLIS